MDNCTGLRDQRRFVHWFLVFAGSRGLIVRLIPLSAVLLMLTGCSMGPLEPNERVVRDELASSDLGFSIVKRFGSVNSDEELAKSLESAKSQATEELALAKQHEALAKADCRKSENAETQDAAKKASELVEARTHHLKHVIDLQSWLPFVVYRMSYRMEFADEVRDDLFVIHNGKVVWQESIDPKNNGDLFQEFVRRKFPKVSH